MRAPVRHARNSQSCDVVTNVIRVSGVSRGDSGRLRVRTGAVDDGPFDAVVNALWEGRLSVDASIGVPPPATWSHRYRRAAFIRTSRTLDVPSAVICTLPLR